MPLNAISISRRASSLAKKKYRDNRATRYKKVSVVNNGDSGITTSTTEVAGKLDPHLANAIIEAVVETLVTAILSEATVNTVVTTNTGGGTGIGKIL